MPSNFEHRVHTGFDKREQRYVGLPLQWASIVGNNQILKSTNRPLPLVDPSEITPTEILDLKTIVRPHHNNNKADTTSLNSSIATQSAVAAGLGSGGIAPHSHHPMAADNGSTMIGSGAAGGGIVLPKTSHVARSNSLRSSSPPRIRRDLRGNANVPPAVPEEVIPSGTANSISAHLINTNMPGFKPHQQQQQQQTTMPGISQGVVGGHGMYGTQQQTQNGIAGGPLAVRTDFSTQPGAGSLQYRPGATHLHAQQTSPVGSIASNSRSTHSHISSHSHGHHMNNNNTTNLNNLPMYPSPQGQMHAPPALPPHGQQHHHHQQQLQLLTQQQSAAKQLGGGIMSADQNQNPHHPHLHTKTASRASSSSGGASGIGATSATGGSTATAGQPKQEPRLTHEQVPINI